MGMKRWFTVFAFIIFTSGHARADELITTVFNVIESVRTERILVLSGADGGVYKTFKSEENLKKFKSYIGQTVKLTYAVQAKENIITRIVLATTTEVDPSAMDLNHFQYNQLRQFAPTEIQSVEAATEIFNGMLNDGDRRRSQCFKRAHIWAFDMWSKLNISSQKIFIFYTQRYIQLEESDWWFHVAPMIVVQGEDYVLDGTFMKKPMTATSWKNHFIKSDKVNCPVIENYQDYKNNQWTKLCYIMKVPMYHFSPLDIELRDTKGVQRNHWVLEELQDARRSFKGSDEAYEGLDTGKPTQTF